MLTDSVPKSPPAPETAPVIAPLTSKDTIELSDPNKRKDDDGSMQVNVDDSTTTSVGDKDEENGEKSSAKTEDGDSAKRFVDNSCLTTRGNFSFFIGNYFCSQYFTKTSEQHILKTIRSTHSSYNRRKLKASRCFKFLNHSHRNHQQIKDTNHPSDYHYC